MSNFNDNLIETRMKEFNDIELIDKLNKSAIEIRNKNEDYDDEVKSNMSESNPIIRFKTETNYFRGQIVTSGLFTRYNEDKFESLLNQDNENVDQSMMSLGMELIKGKLTQNNNNQNNNNQNYNKRVKLIKEIKRLQSFWRGYAMRCKLYHTLYRHFAGLKFKTHMKNLKKLFRNRFSYEFFDNFKKFTYNKLINNNESKYICQDLKKIIIKEYLEEKSKYLKIESVEIFTLSQLERESLNSSIKSNDKSTGKI